MFSVTIMGISLRSGVWDFGSGKEVLEERPYFKLKILKELQTSHKDFFLQLWVVVDFPRRYCFYFHFPYSLC